MICFFSASLLQDSEMLFQPESDQMSPVEPKVRKYAHTIACYVIHQEIIAQYFETLNLKVNYSAESFKVLMC